MSKLSLILLGCCIVYAFILRECKGETKYATIKSDFDFAERNDYLESKVRNKRGVGILLHILKKALFRKIIPKLLIKVFRKHGKKIKEYLKRGSYKTALRDFYRLKLKRIISLGLSKTGYGKGGLKVMLRRSIKRKLWILEMTLKNKVWKVCYDKKK